MSKVNYEQVIVSGIKKLPPESLREVADFVYFLRKRTFEPNFFDDENYQTLLENDLSELEINELSHLEQELKDYEQLHLSR